MGEHQAPTPLNTTLNARKYFRARLSINSILLLLNVIATALLSTHQPALWFFSQIMAGTYGLSCIVLHWYIRRSAIIPKTCTAWHQLLHWTGVWMILYVITTMISSGSITSHQAGLFTLTLIALSVFISGVYTDPSLILVGISLNIITVCHVNYPQHLFLKMIPVLLITGGLIFLLVKLQFRPINQK